MDQKLKDNSRQEKVSTATGAVSKTQAMTCRLGKSGVDAHPPSNQLPKILVVDDLPENLVLMRLILNGLDIEIIQASSGQQALALTLKHKFAVVLMDVNMPEMTGIEAASLMQSDDINLQIPIIFVTADDFDDIGPLDGYAAGAVDYIVKPVNPRILVSKVKVFLTIHLQSLELEKKNIFLELLNQERQRQCLQMRHLLDMNPDGMLVVDHKNTIIYSNPAAADMFDQDAEEMQDETFNYPIFEVKATEITIGTEYIAEMSVVPIEWVGENDFLVTLHDITKRKQNEDLLFQLAQFDHLTGLANRRNCIEYTIKALARAKRRKSHIAVMFIDLDKFKDVNDSLGHEVGDTLLRYVAERLQACVREGDLVARLGGDEFALVLEEITTPEDAAAVAQKIMAAMAPPHPLDGKAVIVACSIGIAIAPESGDNPEALFKSADLAMYSAKSKGRNNFQFFSVEMQHKLELRLRFEDDLHQAIEEQQFELHYQPQIDVCSGKIVGMEALLRWHHHDLGLIPPDRFIPIIENNGSIVEIGEWVLRTACEQVKRWHAEKKSLTMAVNISIQQLINGDFIRRLERVIQDTGIDPQWLELEVTESMMMNDAETMIAQLETIREMGIEIAMDDFGTGYSSLSYLRRMPLHTLKIDRSFINELGTDHQCEILIKTIIDMAHNLELRVVAEGVETADQAAFLRRNKCDLMQGYYFSKPLPVAPATLILQEGIVKPKMQESQPA